MKFAKKSFAQEIWYDLQFCPLGGTKKTSYSFYLLDGRRFRDLDGVSPVISRLLTPSSIFHARNCSYSTRINSHIRIHVHKRKCYV